MSDAEQSCIHMLDETTINKIAAGEVVERPASVVKELLDNCLDAGATDVRVEIEGFGSKLVAVIDNGSGMSRDDVEVAFSRHSTSKIRDANDLETVATLGFRGEALSSIAAIAKVELISCLKGAVTGVRALVLNGMVKEISDTGAPVGTSVYVRDLFYNTPVRKKYLRSRRTELAHITDVLIRHCLGNPNVSFTLVSEGKVILRSPASGKLFDTMVHLLGKDVARLMIGVRGGSQSVSISGYVSRPEMTRGSTDLQYLFINGRPITSRDISNAVRLGYYTLIPRGRYPVVVMDIDVDPVQVDVNVHPTKREVRLSHEHEILDTITHVVEEALRNEDLMPEAQVPERSSVQASLDGTAAAEPSVPVAREAGEAYHAPARDTERRLKRSQRGGLGSPTSDRAPTQLSEARIIGQVNELYIVAEVADGFMLIDQHAAHERVMYEQVCQRTSAGWQELIIPVTLQLSAKEIVLMEEYIPYLEELGFSLSEFGPNTYVVTTVPDILGRIEDPDIVHDIISDILAAGRIRDDTGIHDHLCKSMACRSAIKAGATCSREQMEDLIQQLDSTANPYTCPHGRPTMISFTRGELDKLFKRTG
ncbi:MAG: DNA mismatch repair endonuclease MutL [Euryarchaeota archaeon]|nr:DNA mismatch repair endonuclease MutL [Euryarchaeota archaeon]